MFSFFSIISISICIIKSSGNPVININNITEIDNPDSESYQLCDRNIFLISNQSLFELLNVDRFWFVLARTKFIYGVETWTNTLMQTTTTVNGTTYLQFIGENSNGSCKSSEKASIVSNVKTNRVSVQWDNKEGFLEMVFLDELLTLYTFCYAIDSNQTDLCTPNQTEQFIVQNNHLEHDNDTLLWLKSHCPSIDINDFAQNDNSRKCLSLVTGPEFVDVNTTEEVIENTNTTMWQTVNVENVEEGNVTTTPIPAFEFTTRTNRTNRLEVLEEYYANSTNENLLEATTVVETKEIVVLYANASANEGSNETNRLEVFEEYYGNSTNENLLEATTPVEMKEIVVLYANASANEDANRTNVTVVEEIEPVVNATVDGEVPLIVLHKAVMTETTTEVLVDSSNSTEIDFTDLSKNNDSIEIEVNSTTPINPTPVFVTATSEVKIFNESTTSAHVENHTISVTVEDETSTIVMETTVELTTVEPTTSTAAIPADCPVLKDCPFDYCAFARKLDHRGCPTCNCLQSNKSNITCPTLTCQTCLYGHHTDPNGCPVCQCQIRPYPPLGERCPQLNCEPCYFGTVKDEYNCDTCVCIRPNSQECPVLHCKFGPCKYGSTRDQDDCPTCDCLLPAENTTNVNCSSTLSCPSCHLGYVKDADGCETCQCKLRGSVPCVSVSSECHCDYGSYLNSDGCETCSCLPNPKNVSQQACWELLSQANFHNLSAPTCAADGSFHGRQCDKTTSKCWCVTPTGIHISGFESRPEDNVNCACAVELYQVSSLRMIGHHLLCLLNGNYAPVQCDGRYCSCVDEHGTPIGPSVSIQNRDQLRCVGVYQQLHPERFLLHQGTIEEPDGTRLPYGLSSSLCLTHLEQIRHANVTDDHILIPVCDANGLYAPVQCDQTERYCWCVDKKTGVEMDGTRRLNARPNCNTE